MGERSVDAVDAFVNAMLSDRAPMRFRADPDDAEILRAAIALRRSCARAATPDPGFVDTLRQQMAEAHNRRGGSSSRRAAGLVPFRLRPPTSSAAPRTSRALGSWSVVGGRAAAIVALVAGTVAGTSLVEHHSATPVSTAAAGTTAVRSAELVGDNGRRLGHTFAYSGTPSWVFMDMQATGLEGKYMCDLHLTNGSVVTAGMVVITDGASDWAHTINVPIRDVRQALLVSPEGVTVATARFS